MSKKELDVSRRKLLAGLGTAGVAAAGAGLGTTAYLNDTESLDGNQVTAGTLDLKVDWQQAYYGPTESLVPVNAYPDHDGDGLQSIDDDTEYQLGVGEDGDENVPIEVACADIDSGDNLPDDVFSSPSRADEYGGALQQDSLLALDDVKPGDWGEITFSLHLCSNPGYIWLTAENATEDGGETTEPEAAALADGESDDGELAENTFVELWYDDNCDNTLQRDGDGTEGEAADVVVVMDVSSSMAGQLDEARMGANSLISALGSNDQVGLVSFSSSAGGDDDTDASALDAGLTDDHSAVQTEVNNLTPGGTTNMEAAVERAHEELLGEDTFAEYDESGNARADARKFMVFLGDGAENEGTDVTDSDNISPVQEADNAKDDGVEIFTIAYGSGSPTGTLGDMASDPSVDPEDQYVFDADVSDIVSVFEDIGGVVGGGEVVILGEGDGVHTDPVTLAEAIDIVVTNDGMIPLDGTGDMGYDAGDTADERDCFAAETQHCIGLRWWVPTDVGNEIQGDSCSVDLGFYAEQCRHSDGSRPGAETATPTETPTSTPDGNSTQS